MAQPIRLWRSSSHPQSKPDKSLVWSFFYKLPSQTLSPSSPATTPPADAPPSSLPQPNSKNKRQESGRSSSVRILITVRKDGRTGSPRPPPAHTRSPQPVPPALAPHTYLVTYLPACLSLSTAQRPPISGGAFITAFVASFSFSIVFFFFFFQILHGIRIHPVIALTRKEIPSCPQNR